MIDDYILQRDCNLINSYLNKNESLPKEMYIDFSWNRALFFAKIILASQNHTALTEKAIQAEIAEYNQAKRTNVSLDYLLNQFWLRKVLGQIKISEAILRLFSDDKIVEIPEELNEDELTENFHFMEFLVKKYKYEDSRTCEISSEVFDSIYMEFKTFYPKMPELQALLQEYLITKEKDKYVFVLWRLELKVNKEFLSSYILYSLFQNRDPSQDAESLKEWLVATKFIFCPEAFESLSEWHKERYIKTAVELLKNEYDLEDGHESEKFLLNEDLSFCSFYSAKDIILRNGLSDYTIESKEPLVRWLKFFSNRERRVDLLDYHIREDCIKLLQSLLIYLIKNPKAIALLDLFENKSYLLYQTIFYLARINPAYLLAFVDNKQYGLIFFCSFLILCEDSFNKKIAEEHFPFKLIDKYTSLFCEKNLISKENYRDASLLLMFLIEGMYDSRWPALYRNVYKKICSLPFFKKPTNAFVAVALDCCERNAKDIWTQRIRRIKICEFEYLFFFYVRTKSLESKQCFDLIKALYEDSVLRNEKFNYWSEWNEIDSLEWDVFFNQLFELGELKDFCLNIFNNLSFDENESDFDKKYSGPKKLRLHLKLLCLVYSEWRKYEDNEKVEMLEECLVIILQHCFVNKIEERKIAIFDQFYESHWGLDFGTELLPLIIASIKNFSKINRTKILSALAKGDDLRLLVKVFNLLDDVDDRLFVEKNINLTEDIDRHIYSFDDYIVFLRDLYNSHLDDEFADNLFVKLEESVKRRAKGQIIAPFVLDTEILKIYGFYRRGDKKGLLDYRCSYKDVHGQYQENIEFLCNERLYLIALINVQNKQYEIALRILNQIKNSQSDLIKYESLKVYVQSLLASNDQEYTELLKKCERLLEIKHGNEALGKRDFCLDNQYLYYSILILWDKKGNCGKLRTFYSSIDENYRSNDFFVGTVNDLLKNKIVLKDLIQSGAEKTRDVEEKCCVALKNAVSSDEKMNQIETLYDRVLSLSKEDRFKVFPDAIYKHKNDVGLFIVQSICFCLDKLLGKIATLKFLPEDNKNDLLQIMLESSFKPLNYEFDKDQSRHGLSLSGRGAGELDLVLKFDTYSIVIEAVRYHYFDDNVKEHVLKIFKYDSSKRVFVNLMYYENDNSKFFQQWDNIVEKTSNNKGVVYPPNFSCLSHEDISEDFNNASIKVLKNRHENGLFFFHIFVNLSYAD